MKNKTKILSIIAGCFAMIIGFSSCIKNRLPLETDFSGLQDHVVIVGGGLTNFTNANVGFNNGDTTTVTLIVNLASVNLPSSPLKVTIGVDAAQMNSYNSANGTSYVLFDNSAYSIASTSLTIPAGQQYAETTVSFYKSGVDPTVSYMLPLSITDASGKQLTGNLNTIFYHFIGNPLAGNYTWNFTRWSTPDSTTAPDGNSLQGGQQVFFQATLTPIEEKSANNLARGKVYSFVIQEVDCLDLSE